MATAKGSSALLALLLTGCSLAVSPLIDTATPTATPTAAATDTTMPTMAPTATQEPTPIATQTMTPTADWNATPTQIWPATPSIIEATPLGGYDWWITPAPKIEDMAGTYTPYGIQNVRYGPGIGYAIRYRLAAGNTVQVYAWVSSLPEEAWLCLDGELCAEALALVYDGKEMGELILGN